MERGERDELFEELLARLRAEGVPQGSWLFEIDQARLALNQADSLLRRLRDAILSDARDSIRDER